MSGVRIPVLYKNFVIDEHQLLQARLAGASTVLLIAACLDYHDCKSLLHTAHSLGLEVLLEMHSEDELQYAELDQTSTALTTVTSTPSKRMSRPRSDWLTSCL